jgi:hypothetical protein
MGIQKIHFCLHLIRIWLLAFVSLGFSVFYSFAQPASFTELSTPSMSNAKEATGVSIADYDNDGDDDIFIAANPCRIYRNDGNFQFAEVAGALGISAIGKLGLWLDADNDGWLDLLVSGYNFLDFYHNNNGSSFSRISTSGLRGTKVQIGLMAGDLNGDGLLDVYVNNFKLENQLFLNYGDNQFRDRIQGSGSEVNDQSMAGVLLDVDQDNDLDIYITFDGYKPNRLFINNGSGSFLNQAAHFGVETRTQGMGVDIGDFNRDGKYDFYIANLFENSLLKSNSQGLYQEVAKAAGVNDNGMGWGVTCFDFNNDKWTDIYLNNEYNFSPFANKLYKNNGDETFTDAAMGTVLENRRSGFGCAAADFNSDGLQDLVLVNSTGVQAIRIFRNTGLPRQWLELTLVDPQGNKFATGAHVKVYSNNTLQMDDVTVGSGWYSQNSYRLHFGMAEDHQADSVVITWVGGRQTKIYDLPANNHYLISSNGSYQVFTSIQYQSILSNPNLLIPFEELPGELPSIPEQASIARLWNEQLLEAIRNDFARPTVHARNLFHVSAAMYDSWAVYDDQARTFFLGNEVGGFHIPFEGIDKPVSPEERERAREIALSYASFQLIKYRFRNSPGATETNARLTKQFQTLGLNSAITSTDYSTGSPEALGNYIAEQIIAFGKEDGSNEDNDYANRYYNPLNPPFRPELPGISRVIDPNRWQPLQLKTFIDQSGFEIGDVPAFLSAEWGRVVPFSLTEKDLSIKRRNGQNYWVYLDPGKPPTLDTLQLTPLSEEFKKSFLLVSMWSSHLDPSDGKRIDISPRSIGNIKNYPVRMEGHLDFYNTEEGGDSGTGREINPKTGLPYVPQWVYRGDYTRVLAEFWADGPKSETPPGHWFSILNSVNYHPALVRKFQGMGPVLPALEWDVKSYLALGGALHDAAVATWGVKGFYDYARPVSAIRSMAQKGQSSNRDLPGFHPAGIPLIPGFSEIVKSDDPLVGSSGENLNKVKLYAWKGPSFIKDPKVDVSGVGWILGENWWPYQRPTFVTPPFAGYVSGHSTFSSAAAELITQFTADPYFPGGLAEYVAKRNEYLVFEEGPSEDVKLQWATYKDAADQCSLSRIWGGIHPPFDDFPGRRTGTIIGQRAFQHAKTYFDGSLSIFPLGISYFPNPSRSQEGVTLLADSEISKIEVFDLRGKQVSPSEVISISSRASVVRLEGQAPGMYILRVTAQKGISTVRVILSN